MINHDRRVADVETVFDPARGNFNNLFASTTALINSLDDGSGYPPLKQPQGNQFLVRNIFTDFKRHDVGPGFYERNYDGTLQKTVRLPDLPVGLGSLCSGWERK